MDILEDSLFKAFIQNRGIRKGTITRYKQRQFEKSGKRINY